MGQKPLLVWFTGFSASGKSTLAMALEVRLHALHHRTYLLDGDNVRKGLSRDLNYSEQSRNENIRRVAEVANLMLDAGLVVLAAFISPLRENRYQVKDIVGADNFLEVFVDCPLAVCEQRDVKGLYQKARAGLVKDFTGISAPFERPDHPDLTLYTDRQSVDECLTLLLDQMLPRITRS